MQVAFPLRPGPFVPADGLLSYLDESNATLKRAGLSVMNERDTMNLHWFEFADRVADIEKLAGDATFPDNKLAALIASKLYFYLKEHEDTTHHGLHGPRCMQLALAAGDLFTNDYDTLFVNKITSICLDTYTTKMKTNFQNPHQEEVDTRLLQMVEQNFNASMQAGQLKECIGFALGARRLDLLSKVIQNAPCCEVSPLLTMVVSTCIPFYPVLEYRKNILQMVLDLHQKQANVDFVGMAQSCIHLQDAVSLSNILEKLIADAAHNPKSELIAYQLAFDIEENSTQQFIDMIIKALKHQPEHKDETSSASSVKETSQSDTDSMRDAPDKSLREDTSGAEALALAGEYKIPEQIQTLISILEGGISMQLHLQFLIKNNHTDMIILKNIKDAVRNSVGHSATVIANGLMHAGTTCDDFLRDHLDWVSKATNWNKFSAVASLGVIHRRHEHDAMAILEPYLPKPNNTAATSGYMEGGGLYALGLIFANHGNDEVVNYLRQALSREGSETCIKHGACLGLGLAAMGTKREDIYNVLKAALFSDDAVTGEAAGLAMGLVMMGTAAPLQLEEMLTYATETRHEKIIRGLAMGLALLMFGRLEEADELICRLCEDKEPVMRCSGVFTLALAYAGTGNSKALKRLLFLAVGDTSDDVKRAAASAIGMLFFKTPEMCPSQVSLLLESYNPHVRYGAAIALATACAGTGSKEALNLLEPMQKDAVAYVRQGVFMAMAMVMVGHNDQTCAKVKEFRDAITKAVTDRHEDTIAKFGAVVAQGIMDAGGRNVTIGLQTRTGHTDEMAVVGLQVFLQYWTWFPLSHFLALAFRPNCLIGLNRSLKVRAKCKPFKGVTPSQ